MFDEMMGVERKVEEGLEEGEGLMEVLGLGDLWEFEKNDGVEREYMGFLLCPPSSLSLSASSTGSSRMLSFSAAPHRSNESFSLPNLSSSPSSITTSTATSNSASKASKKAEASGGGRGRRISSGFTATVITSKKPKTGVSSSSGAIKVRKEKLGERITALQQLVSPFGKSDTASVLHEALGYIRFLHDQVQVLSSPYLQRLPHLHNGEVAARGGLRSRGLCLVPISCTEHVADSNGADLWSPSMGSSDNCSSSKH